MHLFIKNRNKTRPKSSSRSIDFDICSSTLYIPIDYDGVDVIEQTEGVPQGSILGP